MPTYTVLAAAYSGEPKDSGYGPKRDIALRLRAADGIEHDASWWTKADTPLPQVGSSIEGDLTASNYGLKFKKARSGGGFGRDPKDTRAMSRSAAQERALSYMLVKATMGVLKEDFKPDALVPLIEWFQNDVNTYAADGASPGMVKGLPVRNEPQPTGAPEPTTPSADYTSQIHPEDQGDVPWGDAA